MSDFYPYTQPRNVEVLKAKIASMALDNQLTYWYIGEYLEVVLYDAAGQIVWVSARFKRQNLPAEFLITYGHSFMRQFRLYLVAYLHRDRLPVIVRRTRLPRISVRKNTLRILVGSTYFAAALVRVRRALSSAAKHQTKPPYVKPFGSPRKRLNPETRYVAYPAIQMSGPNVTQNNVTNVQTYLREYTTGLTPGFFSKKGKKDLPDNTYYLYSCEIGDGGYFSEWSDFTAPASSNMNISSYYAIAGTTEGGSDLANKDIHLMEARGRALGKLIEKSGQEVNNLAQDFAQMNQLTAMIEKTCIRIGDTITALRHKNIPVAINILWSGNRPHFRKGKYPKVSNSLADNWLEMQYGWKPLLQDIEGAAKSLAYINYGSYAHQTVTATAYENRPNSLTLHPNRANPPITGREIQFTETWIRFGVRFRVDDRLKAFLAQTGFSNPVNLIWELLPYSFVVDWFLPIGNMLQTINAFAGLNFVGGYESRFTKRYTWRWTGYRGGLWGSNDKGLLVQFGNMNTTQRRHDRIKLYTWPTASRPFFKNPLSTVHALNAIALMKTAFSRLPH